MILVIMTRRVIQSFQPIGGNPLVRLECDYASKKQLVVLPGRSLVKPKYLAHQEVKQRAPGYFLDNQVVLRL